MAIRQSIRGLSRVPAQTALLRRAFERLMSRGDDRGYQWFASIHGLPLPEWCEHSRSASPADIALLFFPWHRAYLYYFELALQSRLGPRFSIQPPEDAALADLGLPWWDWTSVESHQGGIPSAYSQAPGDGQPNPLASALVPVGTDRTSIGVWSDFTLQLVRDRVPGALAETGSPQTQRDPDPPNELPRYGPVENPESVEAILTASTFEDFSIRLESGPHNEVHTWVGGAMTITATAAFDPIFWSHHAMIDRLWYIWQNRPHGQNPPQRILDRVLTPFPMTVAQTLDISVLGYEYAVQASQ